MMKCVEVSLFIFPFYYEIGLEHTKPSRIDACKNVFNIFRKNNMSWIFVIFVLRIHVIILFSFDRRTGYNRSSDA